VLLLCGQFHVLFLGFSSMPSNSLTPVSVRPFLCFFSRFFPGLLQISSDAGPRTGTTFAPKPAYQFGGL
jgi:hypothetical protein